MLQKSGTSQDDMVWPTFPFIIGIRHKTPFPIISWFQIHHHQLQSFPILYLYLPVGPNVSCFIQAFQMNHHQYLLGKMYETSGPTWLQVQLLWHPRPFCIFPESWKFPLCSAGSLAGEIPKVSNQASRKRWKRCPTIFSHVLLSLSMSCSKFKLNRHSR